MRSLGWSSSNTTGTLMRRGSLDVEWWKDRRQGEDCHPQRRREAWDTFPHGPQKESTLPTARVWTAQPPGLGGHISVV